MQVTTHPFDQLIDKFCLAEFSLGQNVKVSANEGQRYQRLPIEVNSQMFFTDFVVERLSKETMYVSDSMSAVPVEVFDGFSQQTEATLYPWYAKGVHALLFMDVV